MTEVNEMDELADEFGDFELGDNEFGDASLDDLGFEEDEAEEEVPVVAAEEKKQSSVEEVKAPKRGRKRTPAEEEPEAKSEVIDEAIGEIEAITEESAEIEEPVEAVEEAVEAVEEAERPPRKKLTLRQKFVNAVKKRSGLDKDASLPKLEDLVKEKGGTIKVPVSQIALFIKEPEDELLKELFEECRLINDVNLSAEVTKKRVLAVGELLLKAGRMYQPIQIANIPDQEDKKWQCISGRHRLIFLALAYGSEAEISVEAEDMSLCEARDAVLYANMARSTTAMEKIEYTVLASVGGNVDAERDDMFANTVTKKSKAKKYASYCVFKQNSPTLAFKTGTRSGGGLTTIAGAEGYWGQACPWNKEMTREAFDAELESSTIFLNSLAEEMQKIECFDAAQHMASMTMSAIGKAFCNSKTVTGSAPDADKVAGAIVDMGAIGRQSSDVTYNALMTALR